MDTPIIRLREIRLIGDERVGLISWGQASCIFGCESRKGVLGGADSGILGGLCLLWAFTRGVERYLCVVRLFQAPKEATINSSARLN